MSDFSFSMIAVVFGGHQYKKFCSFLQHKLTRQSTMLEPLFSGEQIVCMITTIRFPVFVVHFWIDVPHIYSLHMIIRTSRHLQMFIYFLQVGWALSQNHFLSHLKLHL